MDNVSNIEALDHSVNLTGKHATGNSFALNGKLMDNVAYNSNFIVVSGLLIAQDDNVSDL